MSVIHFAIQLSFFEKFLFGTLSAEHQNGREEDSKNLHVMTRVKRTYFPEGTLIQLHGKLKKVIVRLRRMILVDVVSLVISNSL